MLPLVFQRRALAGHRGAGGVAAFDSQYVLADAWQGVFFIGVPTAVASMATTTVDRHFGGQLVQPLLAARRCLRDRRRHRAGRRRRRRHPHTAAQPELRVRRAHRGARARVRCPVSGRPGGVAEHAGSVGAAGQHPNRHRRRVVVRLRRHIELRHVRRRVAAGRVPRAALACTPEIQYAFAPGISCCWLR